MVYIRLESIRIFWMGTRPSRGRTMQDTIIINTVFLVTIRLYWRGYFTAVNLSMEITTSRLKGMMVSRITVTPNISQKKPSESEISIDKYFK